MTETGYPKSGGPMTETQWAQIFNFANGIDEGLLVNVPGSGLTIELGEGSAVVSGTGYRNTSMISLSVAPGGAAARTDLLVLRRDFSGTPIVEAMIIASGARQSDPVGVYDYVLASIEVPISAAVIGPSNVTVVGESILKSIVRAGIAEFGIGEVQKMAGIYVQSTRPADPETGTLRFW